MSRILDVVEFLVSEGGKQFSSLKFALDRVVGIMRRNSRLIDEVRLKRLLDVFVGNKLDELVKGSKKGSVVKKFLAIDDSEELLRIFQ